MKGFVRPLLIGLGIVALAVVGAGAWFALAFDPNDYRDDIAALVRAQTGRELVIEGDVTLTFFPALGFAVGAAHLAQPPGVGGASFASLDGATARVRLLPLLRHRIEVGRVRLDGLAVELERRADGTSNWADLSRRLRDLAGGDVPRTQALSIQGLELAGARVHYVDRQAQSEYTIRDASIETGALFSGAPFAVDARFRLEHGELAAHVKASAEVVPGTRRGALELRDPAIDVELHGAAAPLAELTLRLEGGAARYAGAQLALDAPRLAVRGITARDVRIDGTLSAQSASLAHADALALAAPLVDVALVGTAVPGGRAELEARAPALALSLAEQTLTLDELTGELYGLAFRMTAAGTRIVDAPRLTGRLELAPFSPRELLRRLGRDEYATADPAALTRAELSAAYALDATALRLSDLRMRLDETDLTGELSVGNDAAGAVRFDLDADRLTLDAYLAAPAEPAAGGAVVDAASDTLRALDVEGTLRIGEMQLADVRSTDVELGLHGR